MMLLRPGEEVGANAVLLKYGVGREYTGGRCVRYRSRIAVSTVAERLESCAGGTAVSPDDCRNNMQESNHSAVVVSTKLGRSGREGK